MATFRYNETYRKKTEDELETWGKRLNAEGKFVPLVHCPRDITFWVKQQLPFIRSQQFKDDWTRG